MTERTLSTESASFDVDVAPFLGRQVRISFSDCCVSGEIVGTMHGPVSRHYDTVVRVGDSYFSGEFDLVEEAL